MSPTTEAEGASSSEGNELLLVLDSGGTKTAVWLVESAPGMTARILGRGRSSAGNPMSVGFAEAVRAITAAIDQARQEAGRAGAPIARAVLSVAGALDPEMRGQFTDWARTTGLAGQVAFVPDVLPVLAAGTPECVGVALICGTGSSAFARSSYGQTSLSGGWGYLLGDEGSGYTIGRAALRAALDDEQRSAARRPLTAEVLKQLKAQSAREAAKSVYRNADPRGTLASLAPLVTRAADDGDPLGSLIIDSTAHELAMLVSQAARAVGLDKHPFSLAVTGGVLVGSQQLQRQLESALSEMTLESEIRVVDEPLEGCVRLAEPRFAELAGEWA